MAALGALDMSIKSAEDYGTFVDHLYFVFREGIGQRLEGQLPQSFMDANELRTMLRHDVDHGGASTAGKKRKGLATTFAKYAGVNSPDAADPAQL